MTSSPHIRDNTNTRRLMADVIIALLPACAAGVYFFGLRSLLVLLVTVAASVIAEYITRILLKREQTVGDLSAAVTGLILGMNLPPTIPLWIAIVGSVFAIVIVKQLFGGIGQNFVNPALAARVFMVISWPVQMTRWIIPDAVSSATPLGLIKEGASAAEELPGYFELFIGKKGGCIGEVSAAALLIGAVYLVARRVITLEIPLTYIGSFALLTWIFGGDRLFGGDALYHVLSGGLILGAFFMATDYTTSPVNRKGRLIFGIGCGVLSAIIRLFSNYPEGVSFAILIMNTLVPLIERYTIPRSFGGGKSVA